MIASNTSGLRMKELLEGRSADFKRRFCITHFFNPPRYLKLVEIVAGPDTAPRPRRGRGPVRTVLGKGLVRAKDHPNFIANGWGRLPCCAALVAVKRATPSRSDMVLARPRPSQERRVSYHADVVGIDPGARARHCHEALTSDERRDVFA